MSLISNQFPYSIFHIPYSINDMQQFVVPQFIDVEDKIVGPVTTRQFIILMVTGFFIFLSYRFSDFTLFVVLTGILSVIGGTIAFLRINGRPFHFFLLNLMQTVGRPNLRVWNKRLTAEEVRDQIKEIVPKNVSMSVTPLKMPLVSSRLSELALVVDTGGVYRGEL